MSIFCEVDKPVNMEKAVNASNVQNNVKYHIRIVSKLFHTSNSSI